MSPANQPVISFSVAIFHNDMVRHYLLDQPVTQVGRDPSADILIADPTISRHQLTLSPRADSVWVELNPDSPNVMVCNGRAAVAEEMFPGQVFHIGPYRFEIHAAADLPEAMQQTLHEDPAGPIDLAAAAGLERIAPRWRSITVEASDSTDHAAQIPSAVTEEAPSLSPMTRVLLVAVLCALAGYLIYDFTKPPPPAPVPPTVAFAKLDLLAVVKPIGCQSRAECLERARDAHRIALELIAGSTRDLVTRYKVAKLLHRAKLALGPDYIQIPDFKSRYLTARAELETAYADHNFNYDRAVTENQIKEQKLLLQNILPICREDRQPFCDSLELAYQRFPGE